jgi:hypothetical protein
MQKFFVKAFALILGVSLILNLLGSLADRVAPLEGWRVEHQQRVENLDARRDQIEAITLGSSHSDAVDYSVLGMDGQSLAFAAADLFEVEKYAAYMSDRLPNLKAVFIAVSYYSFSRDNATFEPFRRLRIRYYSMIPAWSPIRGDISNFVLGRLESYAHVMSVVRSDGWEGVWLGLVDKEQATKPVQFDGVVTTSAWGTCSHYTAEQLESHAWDIANRNVTSSSQMAAIHQGLEQDAFEALARTIERLQSKGIRVVLITPTYYERYNIYFMEQGSYMYEDMRLRLGELQQIYQVEYYDFSTDPEIAVHPEFFYNSDHLGDCGRKVFTAKLLEAMNVNSK